MYFFKTPQVEFEKKKFLTIAPISERDFAPMVQ